MDKTLTALYDSFYTPPQAADTREEIKTIHKQLILKLDNHIQEGDSKPCQKRLYS